MIREGVAILHSNKKIDGKTILEKIKKAIDSPPDAVMLERPPVEEVQAAAEAIGCGDDPDTIIT